MTPNERRAYEKKRYIERKELFLKELGGKCVECGSVEDLEFDHVDPSSKTSTITVMLSTRSLSAIRDELAKCQLLCSTCHSVKSAKESSLRPAWNKGMGGGHGSYTVAYGSKCDCLKCSEYKDIRAALRRRTNKDVQRRITSREIEHGTRAGYQKERRRGLTPCDSCRAANTEAAKALRSK